MALSLGPQVYVGSHRLLNQIGMGRHCMVWDAMIDSKSERRALKIMIKEDKDQAALMKHEFNIAKDLQHPNVIRFFEYNLFQNHPYVAMEYFPSINLKQLLQQKGVEGISPRLANILEQAALGLAYIHDKGVIHRDIKPDNYLINDKGVVKLIDFAIAEQKKGFFGRLFGGSKQISGTRSYMSPEQIRGEALDERSDIYSFGCMAYELATAKFPFTGSNTNELLNKHLKSTAPPMEQHNKNVTPGFSALMKKMLAKKPSDRPANMNAVAIELKASGVVKS
jgi:serine/threonine protein kinase